MTLHQLFCYSPKNVDVYAQLLAADLLGPVSQRVDAEILHGEQPGTSVSILYPMHPDLVHCHSFACLKAVIVVQALIKSTFNTAKASPSAPLLDRDCGSTNLQ